MYSLYPFPYPPFGGQDDPKRMWKMWRSFQKTYDAELKKKKEEEEKKKKKPSSFSVLEMLALLSIAGPFVGLLYFSALAIMFKIISENIPK